MSNASILPWLGDALFEPFCMLGIGSTAIFLVGWLLTRAAERQTAATRFSIWQTTCFGVIGLAILLLAVPGIPLGWYASTSPDAANDVDVAADEPETLHRNWPDVAAPFRRTTLRPSDHAQPGSKVAVATHAANAPQLQAVEPTERPANADVTRSWSIVSWKAALSGIWLFVGGLQFLLLIRSIWTACSVSRRAEPITDPRIIRILLRAAGRVGLRHADAIHLRASREIPVPITLGVLRGSVVLPVDYEQWSDDKLEMILAHELAHVRRHDVLMQLVNRLACCIAWFQPLVWIAFWRCIEARETACDDLVLESGVTPSQYGATLLEIAASLGGRRISLAAGVSMAQLPLRDRLQAILSPDTLRGRAAGRTRALIAFVCMVTVAVFGLMRPLSSVGGQEPGSSTEMKGEDTPAVETPRPDETANPPRASLAIPDALHGFIKDLDNNPVAGAQVRVELVDIISSSMQDHEQKILRQWSASTDARGEYRIPTSDVGVLSGRCHFRVARVDADGYAQGSGRFEASAKDAAAGEPLPVTKLRKGRRVTGRIVSPTGEPITDAMIKGAGSSGDPNGSWWLESYRAASDGRVSLDVPVDMEVELLVYAEPFAPQRVALGFDRVDIGELVMQHGTNVVGQVVTQDGQSIAGVVVALTSGEQGDLDGIGVSPQFAVKTDADGRFRLPALIGASTIWVADSVYVSDQPRQAEVTGTVKSPLIAPITVTLASAPGERQITLQAGPTLTVRGAVRWPDGSGAADIAVQAGVFSIEMAKTTTNEDGRYAIELPKPLDDAYISVFGSKDSSGKWLMAHGVTDLPATQQSWQFLTFDQLTDDADGADWELRVFEQPSSPVREPTRADRELEQLQARYREIEQQYLDALDKASSPDEEAKVYDELDPRDLLADDFLEFESQHRGTNAAISALQQVMQAAASVGDPECEAAQARVVAVDRLIQHYLQHQDLPLCLGTFGGGPRVPRAFELLTLAAAESPHPRVCATALLRHAELLLSRVREHELLPMAREYVENLTAQPGVSPSMVAEIRRRLAELKSVDGPAMRAQAISLARRVRDEFGGVKDEYRPTFGIQASNLLFALERIEIGKPAPEMEAVDANGTEFRLSDQRGKVVLLLFSVQLFDNYGSQYEPYRKLVEEYADRPLVVVGIMQNDKDEHVRAAMAKGDITWTSILDGINGPITSQWAVAHFPSVYLVDAKGILHFAEFPDPEAMQEKVASLVAAAEEEE